MNDVNTQNVTKQPYPVQRGAHAIYLKRWQRAGSGQLCSGCSKIIERTDIEVAIELPPESKSASARFHVECFRVWSGS